MGLAPGVAPLIAADKGWLLFHWLGDVYGQALLDLLRYTLAVAPSDQPGLAVLLSDPLVALPTIPPHQLTRTCTTTIVATKPCWLWRLSVAAAA